MDENAQIYTNMIVYLRGSELSNYNQEVVREDIIDMILDGQDRGDSIQKVMGDNYKEICNEIIDVMPKKTKKDKILEFCEIAFNALAVLGLIRLGAVLLDFIFGNNNRLIFTLTVGQVMQAVLIICTANIITNFITKNSFDQKDNKRHIIVLAAFFALILLIGYYFKMVVVSLTFWIAGLLIFCLLLLAKLFNQKLSNVN